MSMSTYVAWLLLLRIVHGSWDGPRYATSSEIYQDKTSDYIIVFDAGSTGTRAQVFHYKPRRLEPRHFPFVSSSRRSLPVKLAGFTRRPGISAFVNDTEGISGLLEPLVRQIADALLLHNPAASLKDVPIYLGATAGMRQLPTDLSDKVLAAVRRFFRSSASPFAFAYAEQARILAGEEEGAFGWLALNRHEAFRADAERTLGAIEVGGGSAQITFIPKEESILAGIFSMHFSGQTGPIHLYTHSFLHFGHVDAFQRATGTLAEQGNETRVVEHPCMPRGLSWHVIPRQWGVSTSHDVAERQHGPVELRGTGHFEECRAVAKKLIKEAECFIPPCSMLGVYQPDLSDSRFVLLGEANHLDSWEVTVRVKSGMPLLQALEVQMQRICALPLKTTLELFGTKGLLTERHEPPCWRGIWLMTLLREGFHIPANSTNLETRTGCCDGVVGHAIYEVNYFPARLGVDGASVLSAVEKTTAAGLPMGVATAIILVAVWGGASGVFAACVMMRCSRRRPCNGARAGTRQRVAAAENAPSAGDAGSPWHALLAPGNCSA